MSHMNALQKFRPKNLPKNLTENIVSGYRSSIGIGAGSLLGASSYDGQHLWRFYLDIDAMLVHPAIFLPLAFVKSPVTVGEISVASKNSAVVQFAHRQWDRFKNNAIVRVLDSGYAYGWAGTEVVYDVIDGILHYDHMNFFHARDVRPLTLNDQIVGVAVMNAEGGGAKLYSMNENIPNKGFWYAHNRAAGRHFGRSQLLSAHKYWKRLAGVDGAEETTDLGAYKYAVGFTEIRFPEEKIKVRRNGETVQVEARDLAREMGELLKSGANIQLPSTTDESGKEKWAIKFQTPSLSISDLLAREADLRKQISMGLGVPPELMEAAETGSGFSGRLIPMMAFLMSQQTALNDLVDSFDRFVLRPLIRVNFGPETVYTLVAKDLQDTFREIFRKDPMGANSGQQQGQPQPAQTGQPDPMQMPEGEGDEEGMQPEADMQGITGTPTGKPNQNDAILAAMLEAQHEATERGSPESARNEIEALSKLKGVNYSLVLGWTSSKSKRGGIKAIGTGEDSGRVLYGKQAEAALRGKETNGEYESHRDRKKARQDAAAKALAVVDKIFNLEEITDQDIADFQDNAHALTLAELKRARAHMTAKLGGAKKHAEIVARLRNHVAAHNAKIQERAAQHAAEWEEIQNRSEAYRSRAKKRAVKTPVRADGTPKEPKKEDVYTVSPSSLHVDPKRFQYKVSGIGKDGVTDELKGVKTWNPELGGVLLVWRDPADGKDYVINGHHRHELASRLGAGQINVRYIDAATAEEARARGALANIAEGRGTATDAAKYLRDTGADIEHLQRAGVSLSGRVAADAMQLRDLSDQAFNRMVQGAIPEETAVAVARHLKDHGLQDKLFSHLEKRAEEGKDWSRQQIEMAAKKMANAGKVTTTENTLWGDIEDEKSTFDQEVELEAHVARELAKRANDYQAISNQSRAERVADAGNQIAVEENKRRLQKAQQDAENFHREIHLVGEHSRITKQFAAELAAAKTKKEKENVKQRYLAAIDALHNSDQNQAIDTGTTAASGAATSGDDAAAGSGPNRSDVRSELRSETGTESERKVAFDEELPRQYQFGGTLNDAERKQLEDTFNSLSEDQQRQFANQFGIRGADTGLIEVVRDQVNDKIREMHARGKLEAPEINDGKLFNFGRPYTPSMFNEVSSTSETAASPVFPSAPEAQTPQASPSPPATPNASTADSSKPKAAKPKTTKPKTTPEPERYASPLSNAHSREEKLKVLRDYIAQEEGITSGPRTLTQESFTRPDIPLPISEGELSDLGQRIKDKIASSSFGTPTTQLYEQFGQPLGLSKHDFMRALWKLKQQGSLRLSQWSGMPDDIPDPDLVIPHSSKLMAYVHAD